MKLIKLISVLSLGSAMAAEPPRIVGPPPPVDAARGLVRVNEQEIRHYPGKGGRQYIRSTDNGETWDAADLPTSYPGATCLSKESPAFTQNPRTGEYFRVEPLYRNKPGEAMYISEGGLDGRWKPILDKQGEPILLKGLMRSPVWVNNNKRLIIPTHRGGCFTWYSDDQGATWEKSKNTAKSPAHKVGGVHKGTRWNHGMVGSTIIELKNKKLWMLARTAQDQHYQSFSNDYGETWSKAEPSRFWGTITLSTLFRMEDGRILLLWCNTTPLPEVDRGKKRGGEDVFTNRDTIHAAISEDDGQSWIGFREIILDEHRNKENYAVAQGSNDRGKHQSEVIQLDKNRVLLSCGQHPLHRRLMIMDVRWLYEKERSSDLGKEGAKDWSTHQYIDKIVGHCGYNRKPGARVQGGALRVLSLDDDSLVNPNQGAVWNFPAGNSGEFQADIRLENGGAGMQLALTDRWFNPTDDTVDQFANYVLKIDSRGKTPDGKQLLTPGKKHTLKMTWTDSSKEGRAAVWIDGKRTGVTLPLQHTTPNGISYVHFYNPATGTDTDGFSVLSTAARIK